MNKVEVVVGMLGYGFRPLTRPRPCALHSVSIYGGSCDEPSCDSVRDTEANETSD